MLFGVCNRKSASYGAFLVKIIDIIGVIDCQDGPDYHCMKEPRKYCNHSMPE